MPNLPRRYAHGWTVVRNPASYRRWRLKNYTNVEADRPPQYPCLARQMIDADESCYHTFLTAEQVGELAAILALAKTDLKTFRTNESQ